MNLIERTFDNPAQLAQALASAIAADLANALDARGRGILAVSGGTTPVYFFRVLAQQTLDWKNIDVTLVDERWVPAENPRANAGLVRANLLQGAAAAAHFVPLYEAGFAEPEQALSTVAARIGALARPFDTLVLGMGDDGHTASFFPGGDHLAAATDPRTDAIVAPMRAGGAGEARITLTLPVLLDTRALYLHIQGESKRRILQSAKAADSTLPISTVLRNAHTPVQVFWCP